MLVKATLFRCSCRPKSLPVVVFVVQDDCPVDFFPADFLPHPAIFSNAFEFFFVRRASSRDLLELFSMDLSGPRFQFCGEYSRVSYLC